MTEKDFVLGQVVMSRAGRDEGRKFVIVGFENTEYVLLVDGDLRKVEKPKKKKVKHLRRTNDISTYIAERLAKGEKLTNNIVRVELEKFA